MLKTTYNCASLHYHLIGLVRLLYGLAIATGVTWAIRTYLNPSYTGDKNLLLVLSSAAFLLGIADFVIYHYTITKCRYKDIKRLILDIYFPTLIFILFNITAEVEYFLLLLFFYFFAILIYFIMLRIDKFTPPRWYIYFVSILTIIIGFAYSLKLFNCWLWTAGYLQYVALLSCFTYIFINFIMANNELKAKAVEEG